MGKNSYLERQRIEKRAHFDAGLQMGRQQILDMMCLTLNDSEVMEKDTFGEKRLLKVILDIGKKIDIFQKAWERDAETDYYRAKLDESLARAFRRPLQDTFDKRYEYCCDFDYVKGKWK
jgi:hypothetical protein